MKLASMRGSLQPVTLIPRLAAISIAAASLSTQDSVTVVVIVRDEVEVSVALVVEDAVMVVVPLVVEESVAVAVGAKQVLDRESSRQT